MRHSSQRGVALVVTLLMLSVITFLAVAFLALSGRERQAVTTSLTQSEAKLIADAGLARAQAEIVAQIQSRTNLLGAGTLVSRAYVNSNAFANSVSSFTNVNYLTVSPGNYLAMLTNLYFDPRLPVFVRTNQNGPLDFRFFLDFNRNGRFETNGPQSELDRFGNIVQQDGTNKVVRMIGDPEYIGLLERPQYNHSGTNRGIGRFAYLVLPVGQSLDWNTAHNYAKGNWGLAANMGGGDGFNRNQGHGAYELNLAAFLQELNPENYSQVAYNFRPADQEAPNEGTAFNDALSVMRYRYDRNFYNQPSFLSLFGNAAAAALERDGIDGYAQAPLDHNYANNNFDRPWRDRANQPWPGSPNTNRIHEVQELFDEAKFGAAFASRMRGLSTNNATAARHSLYRLLSQTTVDAPPALKGRFHLNYTNDPSQSTFTSGNYVDWHSAPSNKLAFFTNVADRLIRMSLVTNNQGRVFFAGREVGTNFGIHRIPIFPATNDFYSGSLHRLLQLAANLHDASSTSRFPSVFRPIFMRDADGLNIVGYTNQADARFLTDASPDRIYDKNTLWRLSPQGREINGVLAFGVPLVIGAKKGLPNFNETQLMTRFGVQRMLEVFKRSANDPFPAGTNQLLIVGITNQLGVELWNSYTNEYAGQLFLLTTNHTHTTLRARTRPGQQARILTNLFATGSTVVSNNGWGGRMFSLPLLTNMAVLANSYYQFQQQNFLAPGQTNNSLRSASFMDGTFASPEFIVSITNRLRVAIVERPSTPPGAPDRLLDYVSLEFAFETNLTRAVTIGADNVNPDEFPSMWNTNRVGGPNTPTRGIVEQMLVNTGEREPGPTDPRWLDLVATQEEKYKAIDGFRRFLGLLPIPGYPSNALPAQVTTWKAPYDATGKFIGIAVWSANDPLVHYTTDDLTDPRHGQVVQIPALPGRTINLLTAQDGSPFLTLGRQNHRYKPWSAENISPDVHASGFKDPMVRWSDDWNFPANKLASVGEIGRVHRGTPWQTVYLKAGVPAQEPWRQWAGSIHTNPTNDWRLADLFTVAPSEEAARGLVSVNQSDYASWAAVLGGVLVQTNSDPAPVLEGSANGTNAYSLLQVLPATAQLRGIVDAINDYRGTLTNNGGLFRSVGEMFAVSALTTNSPYLNRQNGNAGFLITEDMHEAIPRKILSLVHVGEPRYLVYTFGQSLRPADRSVINQPSFLNLVTNYQITGEVVTRTLMRVEGTPQNPRIVVEKFDVLPTD